MIQALIASLIIAITSLTGAIFFGNNKQFAKISRYVTVTAVGVFMSILLFELIPETLNSQQIGGAIIIGVSFILSYILSYELHEKFHNTKEDDCENKGTAILLLIGDTIHNISDGIVLGLAFIINPETGWLVTLALALHEVPQEILEFGVLTRAGYSRLQTAVRNFLSASSIIIGVILVFLFQNYSEEYLWIVTGLATGNLLFIISTNLLPRIHESFKKRTEFYYSVLFLTLGFVIMSFILIFLHNSFEEVHLHDEEEHEHEDGHEHDEHNGQLHLIQVNNYS